MRVAAVDAGQSGTRAVVVSDGGRRSSIGTSGGVRHLARPGSPVETGSRIVEAIAAARGAPEDGIDGRPPGARPSSAPTFDEVAVGLSGFDADPALTAAVDSAVREGLAVRGGMAVRRVVLTSDAVTSYLGAIGPHPGVVVAGGTGLVCLAADGAGHWAWVDGAGYLLGDEGGGSWIGRHGLMEAVRFADGRGGSPALAARASTRFGPIERLPAAIYAAEYPAAFLASFAPDVAAAAATGDGTAIAIWARAADAIARTIRGAASRVLAGTEPIVVACTGSLFVADLPLAGLIASTLPSSLPAARLVPPRGGSLDGSVALAGNSLAAALFPGLVRVFDATQLAR